MAGEGDLADIADDALKYETYEQVFLLAIVCGCCLQGVFLVAPSLCCLPHVRVLCVRICTCVYVYVCVCARASVCLCTGARLTCL